MNAPTPGLRHNASAFAVPNATLLKALLETSPDIVYFKDRESRFVAVSASLVAKHGMGAPDDVLGKTDFDFFEEKFARQGFDEERRIIETGVPMVNELRKETWADGRVTWSLNSKTPLRNEQGAIIGVVGFGKDVTKTKEMEFALERAQRELLNASRMAGMAEVATGVLHNVGNVLTSLNVSMNVLSSSIQQLKADNVQRVAALLRDNAADLTAYIQHDTKGRRIPEFLEAFAARLSEDRTRLLEETATAQKSVDHIKEVVAMQQAYATVIGVVEPMDPAVLMEDSLRLNSAALARHQVTVVREFAEAGQIVVERGKVLQILVNLIRNAKFACAEHAGVNKRIILRIESLPESVRFVVEDNGIGIPAENLTKIFRHGFTTRSGGHGFGLHSSANAAKEMKGTLAAFSEGPGRGATFVLELPRERPAQ